MPNPVYPLQQVMVIKQKRVDDAENVVKEKQKILTQEQEKLAQREAARNKVQSHLIAKLTQMRDVIMAGTTSPKIQQMKVYVNVVKDNLKLEEKKVKDQQTKVEAASKDVLAAKEDLRHKRQDKDKLDMHKEHWQKETRKEMEQKEEDELNEIGTISFNNKQRAAKEQ